MVGEFDSGEWVERLTEALARLAEAQNWFPDELDEGRATYSSGEAENGVVEMVHIRSDVLLALYETACFGKGSGWRTRFGPLRQALNQVLDLLAAHPTLAGVVDFSGGDQEFVVLLPDHAAEARLLRMVGGLMERAMELPEDGCRVASSELRALLDPDGEGEVAGGAGDLHTGYHIAIFHGLRFECQTAIADDMAVLPFENVAAFINEGVLREVAPNIVTPNGRKSLGAIAKRFRWKPKFSPPVDEIAVDSDWGGSFRKDAETFVELLAVSHAAPVVCLVTIHHCIDRVASRLLCEPHYRGSYTWGRSARSFDRLAGSRTVCMDALGEAEEMFRERDRAQYRKLAPIIARLAEAQARSGRFAEEDKILDVAIALERMYELDGSEISHKMRMRVAWFLGADADSRIRETKAVRGFYAARSAIVHNRKGAASPQRNRDAFDKGFGIARRSLSKLLREGPPDGWDAVVVEGR